MAAFTIIAARNLGNAGFGEYAFLAALMVIGNALTTFGTDMLLVREIAARRDLARLPAALAAQLFLSCLFILGVYLAPLSSLSQAGLQAARLYSFSLLPLAFFTVCTSALRGMERMGAYASLNAVSAFLSLGAALFTSDILSLARALLSAQTLSALAAGALCSHAIEGFWNRWRVSFGEISRLLRDSAPMALLGWLGILYLRLPPILLLLLGGAAPTGQFAAASRVADAAKLGHFSAFTALYPALSRFHARRGENALKAFRLPLLFLMGAACALSLALFFLAGPLVSILFGDSYAPSIAVVQILAWTIIPYAGNNFLVLSLLARGREADLALVSLASLLCLAGLTAWWTPALGARGASLAALCAETIQLPILLALYARQTNWRPHEFSQLSQ